jgi:hypothetical protein
LLSDSRRFHYDFLGGVSLIVERVSSFRKAHNEPTAQV